jgi:hypothetical protein
LRHRFFTASGGFNARLYAGTLLLLRLLRCGVAELAEYVAINWQLVKVALIDDNVAVPWVMLNEELEPHFDARAADNVVTAELALKALNGSVRWPKVDKVQVAWQQRQLVVHLANVREKVADMAGVMELLALVRGDGHGNVRTAD